MAPKKGNIIPIIRKTEIIIFAVFISVIFCCAGFVFAEEIKQNKPDREEVAVEDKIISGTLKSMVKALIVIEDNTKLVRRIQNMDEAKFRRRYNEFYKIASGSSGISASYGLKPNLTKEEAIGKLKSYNKQKMYTMIDSFSDRAVALSFKQYLRQRRQSLSGSNIVDKAGQAWNKLIGR